MEPQMSQPPPPMSIRTFILMRYPQYPSIFSTFDSDDDESNEQFDFSISRELLLDPNDVLMGETIRESRNYIVYKGLLKNHLPVALKIVLPSRKSVVSKEQKEQFQKEVLSLSSVKHDNIVKFVGACIEPQLMIVTELVEGGNLQRFMLNSRPSPPDLKMSLSYALDISRAMEYLHSKGIIHRDLNPGNVLVTGDMKQVKVAGFGRAREKTTDGMTSEAGTYRYIAPDAWGRDTKKGEKIHYDQKVDVYSFALTFWALLTNETPFKEINTISIPYFTFQGMRPSLVNIPDEIVPMLESCWAEDPGARLEFEEITILLKKWLNKLCPGNSNDPALSEEESCKSELEGLEGTGVMQNGYFRLNKPKQEKKKLKNKILRFFKKYFSPKRW